MSRKEATTEELLEAINKMLLFRPANFSPEAEALVGQIVARLETKVRLLRDNDAHWYIVPAQKAAKFYAWVESEDDDEPLDSFDRLPMHPSQYEWILVGPVKL